MSSSGGPAGRPSVTLATSDGSDGRAPPLPLRGDGSGDGAGVAPEAVGVRAARESWVRAARGDADERVEAEAALPGAHEDCWGVCRRWREGDALPPSAAAASSHASAEAPAGGPGRGAASVIVCGCG
jgi:hypothetical protein